MELWKRSCMPLSGTNNIDISLCNFPGLYPKRYQDSPNGGHFRLPNFESSPLMDMIANPVTYVGIRLGCNDKTNWFMQFKSHWDQNYSYYS